MKRCFLFVLLLLVCLVATQITRAESPPPGSARRLSGTVLDPSGAAIAGARVTLAGSDSNPLEETSTDGSGIFRFEDVPPGASRVDVAAAGFSNVSVPLDRGKANRQVLRIVLPIGVDNPVISVGSEVPTQVSTEIAEKSCR